MFQFNSELKLSKPQSYILLESTTEYSDCIDWSDYDNDFVILKAKASQFSVPTCNFKLRYVKQFSKNELVSINLNSSWRRESSNGSFYEEEGITLFNKHSKPIKNYIFIYNQSNNSSIKTKLFDCSSIKILSDQDIIIPHKYNFFNNASTLAVKIDFDSREIKELIIRCSY